MRDDFGALPRRGAADSTATGHVAVDPKARRNSVHRRVDSD